MATLRAIRRRIGSFRTTQQTTRAMKLISAARLRRAQESLVNSRPYSETLQRIAASLLRSESSLLAPAEDAKPSALMVVVTSDRGLAGAYSVNLTRQAEHAAQTLKSRGIETSFFTLGRKGTEHFKRARRTLAGERVNIQPRLATPELAVELAKLMLTEYRGGAISEAGIVYSRFRSALSQTPVYERILPIEPAEEKTGSEVGAEGEGFYLVEPGREQLVPIVLQSYVESAIFHALLEGEASEHGARMTAMDSATNNAADLIERLTLVMNRTRQAGITKELMDIVGGAEALQA